MPVLMTTAMTGTAMITTTGNVTTKGTTTIILSVVTTIMITAIVDAETQSNSTIASRNSRVARTVLRCPPSRTGVV